MIRVSDLILAVAFFVFFSLTNDERTTSEEINETSNETTELLKVSVDSISTEIDVYDSYADFTY